jgi:hypothetical protein
VVVFGFVVVGGWFTVVGVCGTVVVDFGGFPGFVVVVLGAVVVVVVGGGGGVYGPTYSLPACIGVPTTYTDSPMVTSVGK